MTEKWRWAKRECNGVHYVANGPEGYGDEVCVIYTGNEDHCRLIAAAPDMLAALREAEQSLVEELETIGCEPDDDPTLTIIRSAIAKAEGRIQ